MNSFINFVDRHGIEIAKTFLIIFFGILIFLWGFAAGCEKANQEEFVPSED